MKIRLFTLFALIASLVLPTLPTLVAADRVTTNLDLDPSQPNQLSEDSHNVELVGYIGGFVHAVAVQGNYVYLGEGFGLTILDISTPSSLTVVGRTPPMPDMVESVAVAGDYAYIADGDYGLRVVDVSDPTHPIEVYSSGMWEAKGVAVSGNYAYVGHARKGLLVFDVSDPVNPIEVARPGGSASDIVIVGDYAYISGGNTIGAVHISDPTKPELVSSLKLGASPMGISVAGDYAYVAYHSDRWVDLEVIDISYPGRLTGVGSFFTGVGATNVTVTGNYAYVTGTHGMHIVDVSNPSGPTSLGAWSLPYQGWTGVVDVAVAGNYAYLAEEVQGLRVLDVSDPTNPTEVDSYDPPTFCNTMAIAGNYAYVSDLQHTGVRVVDISDPTRPTDPGFPNMPGEQIMALSGSYAHLLDYEDRTLRMVDISNPANPIGMGVYDTPGSPTSVVISGNYAYVADGEAGLRIVDISNPATPTEVGFFYTPEDALDVAVVGNYAYVVDRHYGLRVQDVSDPTNPTEIGFYSQLAGWSVAVAVAGDYAYVANGYNGLRVLDISSPSHPTEVGFYETPEDASGVTISGNNIYVRARELYILRYETVETYSVSGRVVDEEGAPISDVEVSTDLGGRAATGADGYYTINNVAAGAHTLTATKVGFKLTPASRRVDIPPNSTGQDFVAAPLDTGFRPNPDGYHFENTPLGYYTLEEAIRMFGSEAVCWKPDGDTCYWDIPNKEAVTWLLVANSRPIRDTGLCEGMSVTSLLLFSGMGYDDWDRPSDFDKKAKETYDLNLGLSDLDLRRYLTYYHIEQILSPVADYRQRVRENNVPKTILSLLNSALTEEEQVVLSIWNGGQAHALVPYKIEDQGDGKHWVWVYDPNLPYDSSAPALSERILVIDSIANTWHYQGSFGIWDGSGHSLSVVPISEYLKPPVCPWGTESDAAQVWLAGPGHLLIESARGGRLGFIGEEYIDDMPGGYGTSIIGILGQQAEPVYHIPLTDTYTILLDGQTLTHTQPVTVAQFGPGYAVLANNASLTPESQDYMIIAADGSAVSYQANAAKEVGLLIATNLGDAGYQFEIRGADVGRNQLIQMFVDKTNNRLEFRSNSGSSGEYELVISRFAEQAVQFSHPGIPIGTGEVHRIDLRTWDGSGSIALEVDRGSDGTPDEILELDNQAGPMPELGEESSQSQSLGSLLRYGLLACGVIVGLGTLCLAVILLRRSSTRERHKTQDTPPKQKDNVAGVVTERQDSDPIVRAPRQDEVSGARTMQQPGTVDAATLLQQGIAQVKSGSIEAGYASLRRATELSPHDAEAWLWLGWATAKRGDRRMAERCFLQAQQLGHPHAERALQWLRQG